MNGRLLKVVFWGEDAFSNIVLNSIIDAGHKVELVVTPRYDNLVYKKLEFTCDKFGIRLLRAKKINSDEVSQAVKQVCPDLCVIAHFERLIREPILSMPKLGFINLHPSLLPNYRGMAPQHWPIINGEKETGITIHYVDEGTDTGNIIVQRRIPLTSEMYVADLQKIWQQEYKTIMVEAINNILDNKPTTEQKNLEGSYYGKLKEEQCVINADGSVYDAYNLVRGVSLPYYGARINDTIIYKAHVKTSDEKNTNKLTYDFTDGILVVDMYKQINK